MDTNNEKLKKKSMESLSNSVYITQDTMQDHVCRIF